MTVLNGYLNRQRIIRGIRGAVEKVFFWSHAVIPA